MSSFSTRFYKAPTFSRLLPSWLNRSRDWHILYGSFLHNHITHNWVCIGAAPSLVTDEKLAAEKFAWWEQVYGNHVAFGASLEPAREITKDMPEITTDNWMNHISGNLNAPADSCYPSYLKYFDEQLATKGISQILQDHIKILVPGIAGSALHPIIHLGFALETGHHGMISEGLASLCTQFIPLSYPNKNTEKISLYKEGSKESVNIISKAVDYMKEAKEKNYIEIIRKTLKTESYTALQKSVGFFQIRMLTYDDEQLPLGESLNKLMPLSLPSEDSSIFPAIEQATVLISSAYLATKNEFFVIHGATSLHAIIVLMQFLSPQDQRELLVYWWRSVMAVLVIQDVLYLNEINEIIQNWESRKFHMGEIEIKDDKWWVEKIDLSLTSLDEHVPKGTYVMWRWSQFEGMSKNSIELFQNVVENQNKTKDGQAPHENLWSSNPL